jgi:hypothetical protein
MTFKQTVLLLLIGLTLASPFPEAYSATKSKKLPLKTVKSIPSHLTSVKKPAVVAQLKAVPIIEDADSMVQNLRLVVSTVDLPSITQASQAPGLTAIFLQSSSNLLHHMEVLRQAFHQYGQDAPLRAQLLSTLKQRYMAKPADSIAFFDYGYAQFSMTLNKNGLFFLRKASDVLNSPYALMAYAMAEIDADRIHEKEPVSSLTTRKMDAMFKLKDALLLNKKTKLTGVWPNYVAIVTALKPYEGYQDIVKEDTSTYYLGEAGHVSNTFGQCLVQKNAPNLETPHLMYAKDVFANGKPITAHFLAQGKDKPYQVVITSAEHKVVGQMTSFKAPYIFEDLNADGKAEIVIHQFEQDPAHPLSVYQWTGSCFTPDSQIENFFK